MRKTVFLMGGLGNVLYQLNLAFLLKEKGYSVTLNTCLIEINWLTKMSRWKVHKGTFEALFFFTNDNFHITRNIKPCIMVLGLLNKIFLLRLFQAKFFGHEFPTESDIIRTRYFFGYYQKANKISPFLKLNFNRTFRMKISNDLFTKINDPLNVVIHYRSGDKKNNFKFKVDFDKILDRYSFQKLLIITDDLSPLKLITFSKYNHEIISSKDLLEDFKIIQLSRNKILSRSSFSWWAAEISDPSSIIIEPHPFYTHVNWKPFSNHKRYSVNA